MAYSQDTILNANAANVLATEIKGLLVAAGWVLVEELTPSGTYRSAVYRSDGTANECGYDWYVAVLWNTVGTEQQLEVMAGTNYDTGTKIMSGIPTHASGEPGTAGNPYAAPVTGHHAGGFSVNRATVASGSLSSNRPNSSSTSVRGWYARLIPSSAFGYWCSVTLDHFTLFTTIAGNDAYHVSTLLMDSEWVALPYTADTALVAWNNSANRFGCSASIIGSGTSTSLKRNPRVVPSGIWGSQLPQTDGDIEVAYAWRPEVYLQSVENVGGTPTGFEDGLRIGAAIDYYVTYGGAVGDTVLIGGATYVLTSPVTINLGNDAVGVVSGTPQTIAVLVE